MSFIVLPSPLFFYVLCMERLLVKRYELDINMERSFLFIKYKKILKIKFEQAKMIDTIEFMKMLKDGDYSLINWIIRFIETNSGKKLDNEMRIYVMKNWQSIYNQIKNTFFE